MEGKQSVEAVQTWLASLLYNAVLKHTAYVRLTATLAFLNR